MPGMGAERMGLTWLTGVRLSDARYQPRHRSTRQAGDDIGQRDHTGQDDLPGLDIEPAYSDSCAETFVPAEDHPAQDFLDQLAFGEIRRILEGCALDDPTMVVPELVQLVAHSSHTPATLTRAWREFEEATRDAYALHLRIRDWSAFLRRDELRSDHGEDTAALIQSYADDAWRMITQGTAEASSLPSAAGALATHIR